MKERHPIDDLFREGLYNSEVTPPAEVWQRVVAQRSWAHRLLAGLQRRWALGLVIATLVGTPLAWYATQASSSGLAGHLDASPASSTSLGGTSPSAEVAPVHGNAPIGATQYDVDVQTERTVRTSMDPALNMPHSSDGSAAGSDGTTMGNNPVSEASASTADATSGDIVGSTGRPSRSITAHDAGPLGSPSSPMGSPSTQASTTELPNTNPANTTSEKGVAINPTTLGDGQASEPVPPLLPSAMATTEDYVDEEFLRARPRDILFARTTDSAFASDRPVEAPYVLPNGAWWFGVQFGWSQWNGGWTGNSPLVEEMHRAETWQNGWQAGVVGGRTWKSGLSMSIGAEVAGLKSRFLFTEHVEGDSGGFTTMLDTTWQVNAIAPDSSYVVYTYSIDMVEVPIAGERDVRYTATNRYTLLNVPLELAWQKNLRRFTFAPRIGVNANFFMSRTGSTLIPNTSDGRATSVAANDVRTDDRFGMLLCGSAGLDVGYALNERVQLFAGPGYSTVLTGLGGDALRPAISGVSVRGRLVYEFGMKQRKAKP